MIILVLRNNVELNFRKIHLNPYNVSQDLDLSELQNDKHQKSSGFHVPWPLV